jgi:hypothetical protein
MAPAFGKHFFAFGLLTVPAMLFAAQSLDEELQPSAVQVAQQRGASELGCPAAVAEVITKRTMEEPQMTGWYETPRNAEYVIGVSGCGKRTTYTVACKSFRKSCEANPMPTSAGSQRPRDLADDLQPDAIKTAQQRGSRDLACPDMTAQVLRKAAVEEASTTGWYDPPYRAVYAVTVTGCGKQTDYLVECSNRKKGCATGPLQAAPNERKSPPTLADELQPRALQTAREAGSKILECPDVTAETKRKETIEEAQTTGWYDPPYRALYAITVLGCGKQTTYLVACNQKQNRCATRSHDE